MATPHGVDSRRDKSSEPAVRDNDMDRRTIGTLALVLAALVGGATVTVTAEVRVARPRGVSAARAALYRPADDGSFTCLNGEARLPYEYINDDYCDCSDGSDEPGTAACPNGSFHCVNSGHAPLQILSSRVNDGICDCCDGADEYAHPVVRCPNICEETGRAARAEAQRRRDLHKAGLALKRDMAAEGAQRERDMQDRLAKLEAERAEAELVQAEKRKLREEAEALENVALEAYRKTEAEQEERRAEERRAAEAEEVADSFAGFDSNHDGLVDLGELRAATSLDKNRDGVVSEEEARYFLADNSELSLEDFAAKAWPLIKPFLMLEKGTFVPPPTDEAEAPEGDADEDVDRGEEEEEGEEATLGEDDGEGDGEEGPAEEVEAEADAGRATPEYDEETKKLVDAADEARSAVSSAERAVRDVVAEMDKIRESLSRDYGPEREFATLSGQCFEYSDREYVYRLCPFDKATQRPKSGGSETRLGDWREWTGPPHAKHSEMLYADGTGCWNGPNRSTRVRVECGLETKLLAVSEPNRCEYVFEMETPAACSESDESRRSPHDEL